MIDALRLYYRGYEDILIRMAVSGPAPRTAPPVVGPAILELADRHSGQELPRMISTKSLRVNDGS